MKLSIGNLIDASAPDLLGKLVIHGNNVYSVLDQDYTQREVILTLGEFLHKTPETNYGLLPIRLYMQPLGTLLTVIVETDDE